MAENNMNKLDKKDVRRGWWEYERNALTVFGYERLAAPGMTMSMTPIAEKFYKDDKEGEKNLYRRHKVFYNSEHWIGAIIPGIVLSMEERKANGHDVPDELIQNIKVGLMGPMAGIGDSITQGTLFPIILSIAIGLSGATGSLLGPIVALLGLWLVPTVLSYYFYHLGYNLGASAIDKVMGKQMAKIQDTMSVLGLIVTGAITASYVNVDLALTYTSAETSVAIQSILDSIFPKLLPVGLVLLGYYLITKKQFSAVKFILLLLVIAVVGVLFGIL